MEACEQETIAPLAPLVAPSFWVVAAVESGAVTGHVSTLSS